MDNTQIPITLNCPHCAKKIRWSNEFPDRPFCSERCRLIDLGEWASEGHRIAGEALEPKLNLEEEDY